MLDEAAGATAADTGTGGLPSRGNMMWRALRACSCDPAATRLKCRIRARTVLLLIFALIALDLLNIVPLSFMLHRGLGLPHDCQQFEFDESLRLHFHGPDLAREAIEQYTVRCM
jgi:hypothetical protein